MRRVITIDVGHRFDPQSIVIGRPGEHTDVDYAVDDEYVSTRHAKLTVNSMGVVFVEDVGSTNGTYLDGRKLGGNRYVVRPPGALLRVGHTDIELRLVDDWLSKVTSETIRSD